MSSKLLKMFLHQNTCTPKRERERERERESERESREGGREREGEVLYSSYRVI